MNADRVKALADQAAQSADDTADPVTVGRDEWFALMDAIYEPESDND